MCKTEQMDGKPVGIKCLSCQGTNTVSVEYVILNVSSGCDHIYCNDCGRNWYEEIKEKDDANNSKDKS